MSQDNIYDEENQVQTILKLKRIGIYIYIFLIDSPTRAYSNLLLWFIFHIYIIKTYVLSKFRPAEIVDFEGNAIKEISYRNR